MKRTTIALNRVARNPYADIRINASVVSMLAASISKNGWFQNTVVREDPDREGYYQLAYGHHRLEAIKTLSKEVEFVVADLSDDFMKMVAADEAESCAALQR